MPARKSAKEWNAGQTGESRTPIRSSVIEQCTVERCGDVASSRRLPRGWVRTSVSESSEPAREWCSGWCSTVGIALAELRMQDAG
ncbi:hypothetical protein ACIRL2_29245 [Embleya sp. NPDC127516]|uniref:hypothetical protein n=1 Tax=Embleya sp. NPDC127516 TaxID=3363990 RepID=UPI0038101027